MTSLLATGLAEKSFEEFAGLLKENGIAALADARLKGASQLSGFAKEQD